MGFVGRGIERRHSKDSATHLLVAPKLRGEQHEDLLIRRHVEREDGLFLPVGELWRPADVLVLQDSKTHGRNDISRSGEDTLVGRDGDRGVIGVIDVFDSGGEVETRIIEGFAEKLPSFLDEDVFEAAASQLAGGVGGRYVPLINDELVWVLRIDNADLLSECILERSRRGRLGKCEVYVPIFVEHLHGRDRDPVHDGRCDPHREVHQ